MGFPECLNTTLTELDIIMAFPECLDTTFLTELNWTRHYSFLLLLFCVGLLVCLFWVVLHAHMCPIIKLS